MGRWLHHVVDPPSMGSRKTGTIGYTMIAAHPHATVPTGQSTIGAAF